MHSINTMDHRNGEAGDNQPSRNDDGHWKIKMLTNGLRVPYWTNVSHGHKKPDKSEVQDVHKPEAISTQLPKIKDKVDELKSSPILKLIKPPADDVIKCPLCFDPVIEATSSTCGHLFCHDCIHQWKPIKNQCPICQDSLSTFPFESKLHRVYEVDRLIENHVSKFSLDVVQKLKTRRSVRLEQARLERNSKGPTKYLIRKTSRIRLYFQSKGFLRGIGRIMTSFWKNLTWNLPYYSTLSMIFILTLGAILGSHYCCQFSAIHFLTYMWRAIVYYPGMSPTPPTQHYFNIYKWLVESIFMM